jgi:hypothetical protein
MHRPGLDVHSGLVTSGLKQQGDRSSPGKKRIQHPGRIQSCHASRWTPTHERLRLAPASPSGSNPRHRDAATPREKTASHFAASVVKKKNCFCAEALLEGRTSFAIMNFAAPSRCAMTSLVLFELIITGDGI